MLAWLVPGNAAEWTGCPAPCHFFHLYSAVCQLLSGNVTTVCGVTFWTRWLKWLGFKWPTVQEEVKKKVGISLTQIILTWHRGRSVQLWRREGITVAPPSFLVEATHHITVLSAMPTTLERASCSQLKVPRKISFPNILLLQLSQPYWSRG